jgi:glycosyltransferase involved in cell wall biosynthesis
LDWWFSQQISFKASRRKNLHILGELTHEKVLAYLQAADIFVLPSRDEVLPMSLLEAMYYSKPIIAARVGGIPEIISHGENGLILDDEDDQKLAAFISQLYEDRDYGKQLGEKGHEKLVRDLSIEAFGEKWVGIISQLTQKQN